jgi:hypothetical protein
VTPAVWIGAAVVALAAALAFAIGVARRRSSGTVELVAEPAVPVAELAL